MPNTSDTGRRLGPMDIPTPTATAAPTVDTPGSVQLEAPSGSQPTPLTPPKPTFWTVQQAQEAGGLNPDFNTKLEAMVKASGGRLHINSGYRSVQEQAGLYTRAQAQHPGNADQWVAAPGHSNHNRGEAADLGGDLGWAHEHAAQFGLVFPMSWEPWHIEPVGLRKDSSPQAYTNVPGTISPTSDPGLDTSPHEIAASLANAIMTPHPGADLSAATTGGLINPNQPGALQGTYNVPNVAPGSTRSGGVASPQVTGATAAPQAASTSQAAFINEVRPYAEAESKRTGIPAEVMITQAGVETGWGTSGWWTNNRNPAGIGVTGAAGAGNSYATLEQAFHDYADKLLGKGEAGQEQFAADVKAGAPIETLLMDLERSPWAAGHYGGDGLTQTYSALAGGGAFKTQPAPMPQPVAPSPAPSQPLEPVTQRRNM
jgi:hypothetical protein